MSGYVRTWEGEDIYSKGMHKRGTTAICLELHLAAAWTRRY